MRCEQPLDLTAQGVGSRKPQGGQQAEADRLTVAITRVAGGGLDRVAHGVAEVEDHPAPGVPLIRRDHLDLGPGAVKDHVRHRPGVQPLDFPDARPERVSGDQRGLDDLDESGGELLGRKCPQRHGIGEHRDRHVVGADVVLGLGKVHSGLAAVGRIDLGDEGRGRLDQIHAPLVGGRAEAGEISRPPRPRRPARSRRGWLPPRRARRGSAPLPRSSWRTPCPGRRSSPRCAGAGHGGGAGPRRPRRRRCGPARASGRASRASSSRPIAPSPTAAGYEPLSDSAQAIRTAGVPCIAASQGAAGPAASRAFEGRIARASDS